MDDLMNMTIPQLEYLLEGFKKNADDLEKDMNGKKKGGSSKTMTDAEAIQYLIKSGEAR